MASPGGSSGGSAVASGIGLAAFTIGTDTSSSIINVRCVCWSTWR
jgi:Asp-tRNA(Asn)/Glu-tRNA(Gln) amidotransferase A subunit family amidase